MSEITKDTVKKLASLSRIALSEEEIENLSGELDIIVDSMSEMREVADDTVERTKHPIMFNNVMREDEVDKERMLTQDEALSGAPAKEDGKFLVPKMLDE